MEKSVEEMLKETCFVIEATGCEHLDLWRTWAIESSDRPSYVSVGHEWKQMHGWWLKVGELADMPIMISLTFEKIDGQIVCFWEPTSVVIDHRQIDEWFKEHFKGTWDNGTRRATTNAMNFHHCLEGIKQANEKNQIV